MNMQVIKAACGYGKTRILSDVSFQVNQGDLVCLLGPNGVGKTTLFKTILGLLPLLGGKILLNGRNISACSVKELAQTISYVPQIHTPPFSFRVLDIVLIGRTAHIGMFASPTKEDYRMAEKMLHMMGIAHLATRSYMTISGGERQLVLVARALAQQTRFLVMDEPAANLDFGNQIRVLDAIRQLAGQGLGIIMTSHSPDHAFLCATKTAVLMPDKSLVFGDVNEVVTEERLQQAYGVDVRITYVENAEGIKVQTCVPMFQTCTLRNKGDGL